MKVPFPSIVMLVLLLFCFVSLSHVRAQSSSNSEAKALDVVLQQYAYKSLVNPKTGTIYNATQLPSSLTGVKVSALRLRSGSLRRKGFHMYNEFDIPNGLIVKPYVERLVFVYQNLELEINPSGDPISVKFQDVKSPPRGSVAKCVWFDLKGGSNFSNVKGGNTCSTSQQGHFSIVVKSVVPLGPKDRGEALCINKYKHKKKMQGMERAADSGETLQMASVGDTKAPAATVTRTQPTLEHEYAP
ncbi:unnamed protein product [Vicia faba]|uniref:Uncharacterized protein n=1 Tax=Vicia faba TaxID=3906 RepID=A0AAV1AUW8_VICFA|nr:unnamed protein product [Vicia faba]